MLLFLRLIKNRILLTILTLITCILSVALTLFWNLTLSHIIDAINVGENVPQRAILLAIIIIICIASVTYMKDVLSGFTCESLTHDFRMEYARHFIELPYLKTEGLNAGEQLSKLQNEIVDVSNYLNSNLFQLFDTTISFIASLLYFLLLSSKLTILSNLPVIFILIYVVWSSKKINIYTVKSQQAKTKMNSYSDTLLTLFPIIKLYHATRMILGGFHSTLKTWEQQTIKLEKISAGLMSLSALLSTLPLMLLFLIGGGMVIQGTLTLGTLYIFVNLSGNVSGAFMNMPGFIVAFRQFTANMKQLPQNQLRDGRKV